MRWTQSIFKRKARQEPMTTTVMMGIESEVDELQQLQTVVAMQQAKMNSLQDELRGVEALLAQSYQLATSLKVKISEGDADAGRQLDSLEREQRDLLRRQDGLNLRLQVQQADLIPLTTRASELAQERDRSRQDAIVKETTVEIDALVETVIGRWQEACETAYRLSVLLNSHERGDLDAEHKRQVLSRITAVGQRLSDASVQPVNKPHEYVELHSQAFRQLAIVPRKRRVAG
jgi:chromosome segregation ATPase